MIATAFVAAGVGVVVWVGTRDRGTTWYPWPPASVARLLLSIAVAAAALALLAWMFDTMA